jgi:hypothetical protein
MLIAALVVGGLVAYGFAGYCVVCALAIVESNGYSDLTKLERKRDRLRQEQGL